MGIFGPPNIDKLTSKKDIKALIKALNHKSDETRNKAIDALKEFSDTQIMEAVIEYLKNEVYHKYSIHKWNDNDVAWAGKYVELLNKNMSVASIETLVHLRRVLPNSSSGKQLQEKIDGLIKSLGEQATDKIFQLIEIDNTHPCPFSDTFTDALCRTNDPRIGEFLKKILQKGNVDYRQAASCKLSKIKDKSAINILILSLNDESKYVRRNAAEALREIGSEETLNALHKSLQDKDEWVRTYTAQAIGKIKSNFSVDFLINSLNDSSDNVRRESAWSLGLIGNKKAIIPLSKLLMKESNFRVKINALPSLEEVNEYHPVVVNSLKHIAFKDEEKSLREMAIRLLEMIMPPQEFKEISVPLLKIKLDFQLKDLLDELIRIYQNHKEGFSKNSEGGNATGVKTIGEELNKLGGFELMQEIHAEFTRQCGVPGAPRNLEHMWSGIGKWLG